MQKEAEVQKLMEENVRLSSLLDKKEAQLLALNEQCKVMALSASNMWTLSHFFTDCWDHMPPCLWPEPSKWSITGSCTWLRGPLVQKKHKGRATYSSFVPLFYSLVPLLKWNVENNLTLNVHWACSFIRKNKIYCVLFAANVEDFIIHFLTWTAIKLIW